MQNIKRRKTTSENYHPEDRAKASAAYWDLLWLLESLEMLHEDDIVKSYKGLGCDVPEYISKFGIPDAQLRRR